MIDRAVVVVALAAACGKPAPSPPASAASEPAPPPPGAAAAGTPGAAAPATEVPMPTPAPTWIIDTGKVGDVVLGQPLPAALVTDQLATHYVAAYIADAQPVDGFRWSDPPITVYIAGGPFAAKVAKGYEGPPPTDELRAAGAAAARAGATVVRVMVDGPGPATSGGFGVGAKLADLRAADAGVRTYPMPPTREDDAPPTDRCNVRSKGMPGVSFVFATCKAAEAGEPARRVDLWIPE
ncbi:MAG: hypothetical protein R3B06_24130 [Kofleriaceae bacterium]